MASRFLVNFPYKKPERGNTMHLREEKIEGKFLKIAQEHEIVMAHLSKLKEILKNPRDGLKMLEEILPVFQSDMRQHFKIEERFLFPAALLSMPSVEIVDMITILVKEHGYTERDIQALKSLVENQPDGSSAEEIMDLLEKITGDIEKHALIEIEDLFAKMDNNKRCRKIIQGILLEE
jgi:iron-sulfur cluster repair protein YtfE (RIC family)